jgi:hypothetical protein
MLAAFELMLTHGQRNFTDPQVLPDEQAAPSEKEDAELRPRDVSAVIDSLRFACVPPQFGQSTSPASEKPRTSLSKVRPQLGQVYS